MAQPRQAFVYGFRVLYPVARGVTLVVVSFCATQVWSQTTLDAQSWQEYTAEKTAQVALQAAQELEAITAESWPAVSAKWRDELREMLGLSPWPEKTDLKLTLTGSIALDGLSVDRLHYQSRPGLYVAANLYKPAGPPPTEGWPAVLYVCGHARATEYGRLQGNKTAYQHHGLWFARHGVVCLMIDTVQLGEFHGEHHGTYRLGRWDWFSRGYTPAGVEAWNAIRGIDLLCDLAYVDAARLGITGRSGGGAYSWFAAALDERIRAAVPVAGITDLQNHVVTGCVEGHCDCMYYVNYFDWDFAKLAALVAPRPLLLANSDSDGIFPLDGVLRIHQQLVQLYAKLPPMPGDTAAENYGLLITPGPHKDTQELQVGAFQWLLKHLTGQQTIIDTPALKEIEPEKLVVFEAEIPRDERVTSLASWFVEAPQPIADPEQTARLWQELWLPELRRLGTLPERSDSPVFSKVGDGKSDSRTWELWSDANQEVHLLRIGDGNPAEPIVHLITETLPETFAESLAEAMLADQEIAAWLNRFPDRTHVLVRWRGASWLAESDFVKRRTMLVRRLALLGETPEEIMLRDLLGGLQWLGEQSTTSGIELAASGRQVALIELAGLLYAQENPSKLGKIYTTQRTSDPMIAPALLGCLRVCSFDDLHAAATQLLDIESVDLSELHDSRDKSDNLLVHSESEPQQANGMRIVEVDQTSAKIWVRATRWPLANLGDLPEIEFEKPSESKRNEGLILPELGVDGLRHAVPGVSAQVRVGVQGDGAWRYSAWTPVGAETDYSAILDMEDLKPGTNYEVRTQARRSDAEANGSAISSSLAGRFRTLPDFQPDGEATRFKLAVGTCQAFEDRDGPHGFDVYRTMLDRGTDAFVMAGDVVYYDALARDLQTAYYHWQRTYALPTLVEFHTRVPTYFLKDDHDTYVDDAWPGTSLPWTGAFTFEDGQRIFAQQTGLPQAGYRTFRIGSELQIWLMEGRDYRSPNNAPDGADKSIWGESQKAWLKETMDASEATFRIVISPTPLVGPDRDNKRDNHSNAVFATEGREVRRMLASYPNTVSVCGDRHWQYHSIDPESGLHEFSVGPVSDRHAGGWKQEDYRPDIHQFLRVAGGYLEIELSGGSSPQLHLRHLDTSGREQHSFSLLPPQD